MNPIEQRLRRLAHESTSDWDDRDLRAGADLIARLEAANRELSEALHEIHRGKIAADNDHPLGEYAAMALRFRTIAAHVLSQHGTNPHESK